MRTERPLESATAVAAAGDPTSARPPVGSAASSTRTRSTRDVESANPLLDEWRTPFGMPPFDDIEDEHFEPAFDAAMAEQRREVAAIRDLAEEPTFANTVEALEKSGQTLVRVAKVFFGLNGSHSNDAIRALAQKMAPRMAAHRDDILLDRRLFERVQAVHERRDQLGLDTEQRQLLDETYKDFTRGGVNLDDASQARLRQINGEVAERCQRFGQNLLAEPKTFEMHVTRRADLGALPEGLIAAAAREAEGRGHDTGWCFLPSRPSALPFLRYSPNRELRERIFRAFTERGTHGGELDNTHDVTRIVTLRAERARLLGFEHHAAFELSDNMAETTGRVYQLLDELWRPALAAARAEREELQTLMREDGVEDRLRAWDWRYYAEKARQARCRLDDEVIRPYFELTAVRDGAFRLARELFGLEVAELDGVPTWHPDQQAFEVSDGDGRHLGVLTMDFFDRDSKRGGAWMNTLRSQSKLGGDVRPIVTTTFNFPKPAGDSPALLSFAQVETVFHELGHAFHSLLSEVTYPSLSGTSVPRDFVEFPSQMLENWLGEPEVLRTFAHHVETGDAIPDTLIASIKEAQKLNQGFATVEYLAACYLDLAWHTLTDAPATEPADFERREMERIGLIEQILPRYRSTYFRHIFSGRLRRRLLRLCLVRSAGRRRLSGFP